MASPATTTNPHWSVVDADSGRLLPPRAYSTGLTQDEAVRRILAPLRKARREGGSQDVFFVAGTGSGKSLVALNVAARVGGRALVVIPTVNLQDQYEASAAAQHVLRPDGRPLRVASVKGKRRYACGFEGGTAADSHVCSRGKDGDTRWRKAATCPYWAPTLTRQVYDALLARRDEILATEPLPERVQSWLQALDDPAVKGYTGIHGDEFVHVGPRGCGYMDAHYAFAAADVVLLSNRKWQIETDLGRKPVVDLEVFDEADGFLDELFEEQRLTTEGIEALLRRVAYAAKVLSLPPDALRTPEVFEAADPVGANLPDAAGFFALQSLARRLRTFRSPREFEDVKTWKALEAVPAMVAQWPKLARERLRREFPMEPWASVHVENLLVSQAIQDDDENIVAKVKSFVEGSDSLILSYDETGVYFTYDNLSAPLRRLMDNCAPLRLWMSATFPSPEILRQVYGFRDPIVVSGEPRFQGTLRVVRHDPPRITFATWQQEETRRAFARALEETFQRIPDGEQTIVVVYGKQRLLDLAPVSPVAAWLVEEVEDDALRHEERLQAFFRGERTVLASTRIVRGVDFAGDKARNIILLKDPLPNLKSRRFQVFEKKWNPALLFAYADDIASRTLAQMIGRGLRHDQDWVRLFVLDAQIYPRLARITRERARVTEDLPPPVARSLADVIRGLPPHPPRAVATPSSSSPEGSLRRRTSRERSKR